MILPSPKQLLLKPILGTVYPPRIIVLTGSGLLALLDHPQSFDNCIILAIDVPEEIKRLAFLHAHNCRIETLELGANCTIQRLLERHGSPEQVDAFGRFPSLSSTDGLAQFPELGHAAIRELLTQPDVRKVLSSLVAELSTLAGGDLPFIPVEFYGGTAGGTASVGMRCLFEELTRLLHEDSGLMVDAKVHLLGGKSFHSRGLPRIQQNAAVSILGWANLCRTTIPGVTFTLCCFEAPTVSTDREARNAFLLDHHSAMTAPAVERHITQTRSNNGASGPFGNVRLSRGEFFRRIPDAQIRTDLALKYLPLIEALLETRPAMGRVGLIRFEFVRNDARQIAPAELLEQAELIDDPQAVAELLLPEPSIEEAIGNVRLDTGETVPLSDLHETFSEALETPDQVRERLGLVQALEVKCRDVQEETGRDVDDFTDAVNAAHEDAIRAVHKALYGWGMRSAASRRADAEDAILELHEQCDALAELTAELASLTIAVEVLERIIHDLLLRLSQCRDELTQCISYGQDIQASPNVTARPLAEVFSLMLSVLGQQNPNRPGLDQMLLRWVDKVTLDGVARMVGAPDASPESIVASVQAKVGVVSAPHWGGEPTKDEATTFVVYPPVERHLEHALRLQHTQTRDKRSVTFATRSAPSRCVVLLELRACEDLRSLITPFHSIGLAKVLNDPCRVLFLADLSALKRLGIQIDSLPNESKEKHDEE